MATLPPDAVRGLAAALFLLEAGSLLGLRLAHGRRGGVPPGAPRLHRPLTWATGPLWVALQLAPPAALLAEALVPSLVYGGPLTLPLPAAAPLQLLGLLLWFLGGALGLWAQRELGRFTRLEIAVFGDHRLVTAGPYRWVRHPLYTALLMMIGGTALLLLNPLLLALVPVAAAVARRRALQEEELLASPAGLGDAYRRYAGRTGRFLPRRTGRGP